MLIFFAPLNVMADEKQSCKEHPDIKGACFDIRGRMGFYNGNPSARIWVIGTKRILGISEGRFYNEQYANVPSSLLKQLSWGKAMYADFTICPFTKEKPGVMQYVCIENAKNISIRKWP